MQRLIQDASKMTDVQEQLGITVDGSSMSFDNIVNAISVVQSSMGVMGTTSDEAAKTLSGSFSAMQAAASNFMAQLTMGGDVETALQNVADSAVTFVIGNLAPAVGRIAASLPGVVIQLIGTTLPNIINTLTEKLSGLLDGTTSGTVSNYVTSFLPKLATGAGQLVLSVVKAFLTLGPKLVTAAINAGKGFADGIKNTVMGKINALITKIKSVFKFKISLPHISLPHFSISPAGWKLGDLLKGKIPSLGIKWYAEGGIMTRPTLFGMAGGEAGPEAILPLDKLKTFVGEQGANRADIKQAVIEALYAMTPKIALEFAKALEGLGFSIGEREFARLVRRVTA